MFEFRDRFALLDEDIHRLIHAESEKDLQAYAWFIPHAPHLYWVPVRNENRDGKLFKKKSGRSITIRPCGKWMGNYIRNEAKYE